MEELEKRVSDLESLNKEQNARIDAMESIIEGLAVVKKTVTPKVEKPQIPDKTFKVKGIEYQFTNPSWTTMGGIEVKAEEALKDSKLLESIVNSGLGVIRKV